MVLVSLVRAADVFAASLSVTQPRCEYRVDPVGLDTAAPRFSWVIRSSRRGTMQAGYQMLVATSSDRLRHDQGDLWDSGRIKSSQSVGVSYAGRPLASGQTCFWKVRVWDQEGRVSAWSEPARWTMGLLNSADWRAHWIGFEPTEDSAETAEGKLNRQLVLDGCPWIWAAGAVAGDQPAGRVYFRKSIELPADATVLQAVFLLTADDSLQLFVNGQPAGPPHRNWKALTTCHVMDHLKSGTNVLAIEAQNNGSNPAGLIGRLVVVFAGRDPLHVDIDGSWLSSRSTAPGWKTEQFDGQNWQPAAEIARHGDQPWGTPAHDVMTPAPFFRKAFTVSKPISRAVVFASALGVYELHLNGDRVDTDVLSPGWTDYAKRVHYRGYDVTRQLKRGDNVIGAVLGDGWYASYLAFTGRRHYYGGDPRLLIQLQLEYRDGSRDIIATDGSWKAAVGPIQSADLLKGCVYDARAEFGGWDEPGFDENGWLPAMMDETVTAHLLAHPAEPIRPVEEIPAKTLTEPRPGVYVYDLGQNMVGWVRLKAKGDRGQRVVVRHAEMLNPDGTLYTANLRRADATDTYYLADTRRRSYEPHFTFHGFRYVEVTGLDKKPDLRDATGVVAYSDLARSGWFECSEPLVNKLALNSLWGQKGNFLDVPTDCPQRDERAGWTGDAQVFMKTACLNMDAPAFYTKWLRDLCSDSQRADGAFCDVAPSLDVVGYGNTGWSDAGPLCAWRMYEMYGDTRVLAEHYPALERYMGYLAKTSKDFVRGSGAYGDWLRLAGPQHSDVIGTAYYNYTAQAMAGIAGALGRAADTARYRALADDIRAAFVRDFIKPDGRIVDGKDETSQTFYALAFGLDLVPDELKSRVAEQFVASVADRDDHIATGFLGTPFVLFALQKAGHPELAYQLLLNKTYPSWLQQVIWGSTTMWERWDGWRPEQGFQDPGMNSFNHYWLGCVNEWLFTQVAGIDTEGPGFGHIIIHPALVKPKDGFDWVKATYDSIRGPVSSRWRLEGDRFHLDVTVPANSIATVYVPAAQLSDVTEGGKSIEHAPGVKFLHLDNGQAVLRVGSGSYQFSSRGLEALGL